MEKRYVKEPTELIIILAKFCDIHQKFRQKASAICYKSKKTSTYDRNTSEMRLLILHL